MPRRQSMADMHVLAAKRNATCISRLYLGNLEKLVWRCNTCQRFWFAMPNSLQQGSGCPHCAGKARLTLAATIQIGAEKGYIYKGHPRPLPDIPELWVCYAGHQRTISPEAMRKSKPCRTCSILLNYTRLGAEKGYIYTGNPHLHQTARHLWVCYAGHELRLSIRAMRKAAPCEPCRLRSIAPAFTCTSATKEALPHPG